MTEVIETGWTGPALLASDDLFLPLDDGLREELLATTRRAAERGGAPETLTREDFPLPALGPLLARLRRQVLHGRGLVFLRRLPVETLDPPTASLMFWGLGTHLGHAVSQSLMGDRLGHVRDESRGDPNERGYRSSSELSFHTDSDDLLAMLCLRPAPEGGLSRFASAHTVYDRLATCSPTLLSRLERGYRYHWRGEEAPGEPPITEYRVPVLSHVDGKLSCVFLRRFIEMAAEDLGEPLDLEDLAALDAMERIAEETCLSLRLEAGDAFLANNLTVLHSRTRFRDDPDPRRARHLLRLWLKCEDARPRHAAVTRFYRPDGIDAREGGSTVYVHRSAGAAG